MITTINDGEILVELIETEPVNEDFWDKP